MGSTVKTTTKLDLCQTVGKKTGFAQEDCKVVLEQLLRLLVFNAMEEMVAIEIRGFGTFYAKDYLSRPARNPRTGAPHTLKPYRKMLFRPSPDLKILLNPPGYKWIPVMDQTIRSPHP